MRQDGDIGEQGTSRAMPCISENALVPQRAHSALAMAAGAVTQRPDPDVADSRSWLFGWNWSGIVSDDSARKWQGEGAKLAGMAQAAEAHQIPNPKAPSLP